MARVKCREDTRKAREAREWDVHKAWGEGHSKISLPETAAWEEWKWDPNQGTFR